MAVLLSNNAVGELASGVNTTATTLTLKTGQGSQFPSPSGNDWFPVTLDDGQGTIEICHCTARSGDSLTVQRGAENFPAQSWGADQRVALRLTDGTLAEFLQPDQNATIPGSWQFNNGLDVQGTTTSDQPILKVIPQGNETGGIRVDSAADGPGDKLLEIISTGTTRLLVAGNGEVTIEGNKVWHDGNTPDLVRSQGETLEGGFTAPASINDGTFASGSYTPSPQTGSNANGGNWRQIMNGGAFTLNAPTDAGCFSMVVEIQNGSGAGAITFSGFVSGFPKGDDLTTTQGDQFKLYINKSDLGTTGFVEALQ